MSAPHQNELLTCLGGGVCLTLDDLDVMTSLERKKIINAMMRMVDRGYAERLSIGCYQITRSGREILDSGRSITSGPRGKHTGIRKAVKITYRQRAWTLMRRRGVFTIPDLVGTLETVERTDHSNLERYCRALLKVDYLHSHRQRRPGTHPTSNGFIVYELINDTGEAAPVLLSDGSGFYDHNTGKRVLFAEVAHA